MSVHERQKPPSGHGEVLCAPAYSEWDAAAERNAAVAAKWPVDLRELRAAARADAVALAERYSREIGVLPPPRSSGGLIVMTGHQPELYHPGVWVKDFLVQRMADESGALGIDLVVDTDTCGAVSLRVPCLSPAVRVCDIPLVDGGEAAYVQVPPPDAGGLAAFRVAGETALRTLPGPSLARHFGAFCDALLDASGISSDLGTLLTAARRRFERPAGTDYLEIPASMQSRTASYLRFAASLLLDAARFRDVMNGSLAEYRRATGTRSQAQPFPDLGDRDGRIEAPFWLLRDGARLPVYIDASRTLYAGDAPLASLPGSIDSAAATLASEDVLLAPKALALTLFQRLFVADWFVHGTGGGRYDRVTDAVIGAYYGIDPPAFAIASMTLLLPIGAHIGTDDEVAALERRVHRFEHNPDEALGDVEFDSAAERARAEDLARRKAALVAQIAVAGSDRKALGAEIREVNSALTAVLEPVAMRLRASLERARAERDAAAVLTDRTYPYCLWDPREVMDKVR